MLKTKIIKENNKKNVDNVLNLKFLYLLPKKSNKNEDIKNTHPIIDNINLSSIFHNFFMFNNEFMLFVCISELFSQYVINHSPFI
jgi:hypothetical protein